MYGPLVTPWLLSLPVGLPVNNMSSGRYGVGCLRNLILPCPFLAMMACIGRPSRRNFVFS